MCVNDPDASKARSKFEIRRQNRQRTLAFVKWR
jgi:hypothetical protein